MKKYICLLLSFLVFIACKDEKSEGETEVPKVSEGAYAKSAGRTNTLTIVIDNQLWEGEIGNYLRKYLADGVPGLPQVEPLFTIKQMSHNAFSGFARKSRCFLRVNKGKPSNYQLLSNKYARPQVGVEISGLTNEAIIDQFLIHKTEIVEAYKKVELYNRQQVIKKALDIPNLKENLGVKIKAPRAYRVAKADSSFYWLRKNINHGSMDILMYEVPLSFFKDSLSLTQNIIRLRDTYGGDNIPVGEGGRFVTEEAFSPFIKKTELLGLEAYEARGTWEVKNKFMAGPFVNYTIKDEKNKRWLVLEGFVFAPSVNKRDYLFDLEAIIKSAVLAE